MEHWLRICVVVMTAFLGVLSFILKEQINKRRELEKLLEEQNRIFSAKLIELLYKWYMATRKLPKNQKAFNGFKDELFKTGCELVLGGSDELIRSWNKFWRLPFLEPDKVNVRKEVGALLLSIRKNAGQRRTRLSKEDILQVIQNWETES